MASSSESIYDTHPELARVLIEGGRFRVHAAKVSLIYEDGSAWFAVDTLPRQGHPDAWEKTTRQICRILKREAERMPRKTKRLLTTLAVITPDEPIVLFQIETWLSMQDDGGSWWEVPAYLSLAGIALPDVVKASERAAAEVLKVVCAI